MNYYRNSVRGYSKPKKWPKILLLIIFVALIVFVATKYGSDLINYHKSNKLPVGKWHESNMVVAHALGTVDGRVETNSEEALTESYERGFRVFEADLSLTSDNELVLRHDFDDTSYYNFEQDKTYTPHLTKNEFLSNPINGIYTPMTVDDIVKFLAKHKDTYLITDTKCTNKEDAVKQFTILKKTIDKANDPSLYSRIIVQLYNYDMKSWVESVTKFDNYILTLYQMTNIDYNKVGKYCRDNKIEVVTMPQESCKRERSQLLHDYGIKVYTHTVNKILDLQSLLNDVNVDGFYTDFISPDDLKKAGVKKTI